MGQLLVARLTRRIIPTRPAGQQVGIMIRLPQSENAGRTLNLSLLTDKLKLAPHLSQEILAWLAQRLLRAAPDL